MLVFTHPASLEHDTGPGHPERADRIRAILRALEDADLPGLVRREAPMAPLEAIRRAHPEPYPSRVRAAVPASGHAYLDPDTVVSPRSWEAALAAAGGAIAAVDAVLSGEDARAFCCLRPPGHHAEPARAMGFCLFNNVAVAALHARHAHGVRRIAIVDFDVHHGNGTQAIFWNDPDTLFVSTHQWPLYPGTGRRTETGAHGNVLNLPLPPGTDGKAYRAAVEAEALPRIDGFAPELVLISAGFDAHARDPLANFALLEEDFAWITRALVELAERHARGRIVSVLEGGYDLVALAASVIAHLHALAETA
ncbi:MAG: histone deacetylase family protein [Geminicoccaceae bacterium]|nr:histone deacetylase family protein [Geminicoccaceae bacterium]MCS7268966.1 histone deacetylase family protein [Geminicoccaceae bacterium]MDW8124067.1 histone deacetylase family protein [Geminicoccaceae bacterium]MDW8340270.1 histone deacetylase family protein [Geminicoccaceae bacterium]